MQAYFSAALGLQGIKVLNMGLGYFMHKEITNNAE